MFLLRYQNIICFRCTFYGWSFFLSKPLNHLALLCFALLWIVTIVSHTFLNEKSEEEKNGSCNTEKLHVFILWTTGLLWIAVVISDQPSVYSITVHVYWLTLSIQYDKLNTNTFAFCYIIIFFRVWMPISNIPKSVCCIFFNIYLMFLIHMRLCTRLTDKKNKKKSKK